MDKAPKPAPNSANQRRQVTEMDTESPDDWVDITYVGETVKRWANLTTGKEIGGSNREHDGKFFGNRS